MTSLIGTAGWTWLELNIVWIWRKSKIGWEWWGGSAPSYRRMYPDWLSVLGHATFWESKQTFIFICNYENKTLDFKAMKTKQLYGLLLLYKIIREPASTAQWIKIFSYISTTTIWKTKSPSIPPSMYNTDFKIRHKIIYTSTVLHQINKNRWARDCAACKSHPKTHLIQMKWISSKDCEVLHKPADDALIWIRCVEAGKRLKPAGQLSRHCKYDLLQQQEW